MVNRLKIEGLQAELAAVESLLRQAAEFSDAISEFQLSKRKEIIESEILKLIAESSPTANVVLFFGGKPVFGSRGISADFAGDAIKQFQELVSKTFAINELGQIGERGPVPLKQSTNLMVTEIAKGSFGFVLEELQDQLAMFDTGLKAITEEVAILIERTASPNELEFEEAIQKLDARSLIALKDFYVILDKNSATIRIVEEKFDFMLDESAVRRGRERTEATSIDEEDEFFSGTLMGFLPEHRKFEAKLDDGSSIYGSVSKEAAEQYALFVTSDKTAIGEKWTFKIKRRTVHQLNRPPREVYRLLEFVEA